MTTQHPFDEAYNNFKDIPTETLKRNLATNVYGVESWQRRAVEFILKEREEVQLKEKFEKEQAEQRERIQNDFELTKSNVEETKKMAVQTRNLVFVTAVIAAVSFLGYLAQLKSVKLAQISENREETRLQAELRPYLTLQLYPNITPYFQKDGNSQLTFLVYNNQFLILPFRINNVGKMPAINMKVKYDSPTEHNVWFELGENTLSPDTETAEIYPPSIDISSIINNNAIKQFDISLTITYQGNDEIDQRTYCSLLTLNVIKKDKRIYGVKGVDFKFGYGS